MDGDELRPPSGGTSRNEIVPVALSRIESKNVLRGRWESEPAVTVREPSTSCGWRRLIRWKSGTDGDAMWF